MAASGCAALGYQIVWTQQVALWLGHEGAAALAVVAAFFGGLALGAAGLGAVIERSAHPGRWYAACEVAVAAWGLVLALALQPASLLVNGMLGPAPSPLWHAAVAFGGTFCLLLPATLAMGATLPAMERLLAQFQAGGANLAALYAGNTVGGVVGVCGVAFWCVPQWGLTTTALACALLNVACAAAVLLWTPAASQAGSRPGSRAGSRPGAPSAPRPVAATTGDAGARHGLELALVMTGLLGIGYEVVVLRVLSQVAENTVYTLALLLVVYLVGTALGAAAWARWGSRGRADAPERRVDLLVALGAACALSGGALWMAPWFKALLTLLLGGGFAAALWAEALLAALAFGLPTLVMGALFSHLCEEARAQGLRFGTALALNTAGAAAAPVVLGAGLIVSLGAKPALMAVAGGYLVLALLAARWGAGWGAAAAQRKPGLAWVAVAAVVVAMTGAPALVFVDKPPGATVISHVEGALGTVSVVQDPSGERVLRINNRQQEGSNTTALADARQALLPLLLHPAPQRALLLGLGTGVTAQAAALDPTIEVLAVELLPEVVLAAQHFNGVLLDLDRARNLHTQVADARRFVRTTDQHWDVIVSDNFHPARAGSGALYTVEHFQAVRARLAPGGVFCQWLPLHQMDLATLRSIVRSFLAVNPHGAAMLATNSLQTPVVGLWAQRDAAPLSVSAVTGRLQSAAITPAPGDFGLADEWALLGSFVAGPTALARFAAGAPLNTDDHPVVNYRAPRATYAPEATPARRLLAVLQQWTVDASELLAPGVDQPAAARLNGYFKARRQYLAAGAGIEPAADPARMLALVREPLLAALHLSPDFAPAYEPLLRLALALRASDPPAAQALLEALARVAPAQAGAREALRQSVPAQ